MRPKPGSMAALVALATAATAKPSASNWFDRPIPGVGAKARAKKKRQRKQQKAGRKAARRGS